MHALRRPQTRRVIVGLVAGLFVGLAVGWMWYSPDPLIDVRTVGVAEFRRNVFRTDRETGEPRLTNTRVYPAVEGPGGEPIYRVTFDVMRRDRDRETGNVTRRWETVGMDARTPFLDSDGTIIEWLAWAEGQGMPGTWGEAWWKQPGPHYAVFAGLGVLVGGVVVPGVRAVLVRRGLIEPDPEYVPEPPAPKPVPEPEPEPAAPAPEPEPEEDRRRYKGAYYPVVAGEDDAKEP